MDEGDPLWEKEKEGPGWGESQYKYVVLPV